ncbi:ADP-ribosylglycohydrolase family protein [Actinoallomurus purpureus]|uniref:ADP-ribosylglycohydrolase family protein n=1 Tax=Actinoallomurus purpureus TaxID=478114 RepID=UPI002093B87B|nr:ADP-ribosylglycohydrolase family protein [Actinoallomurus purpureus]MCO6008452.1 ADP-ribosylglycohydrolase family protein [Actinoallomurus purpureus]
MTQTSPRSAIELDEAYRHSTQDACRPRDLLADEVAQRRESGYDVDDVVRAANATDPDDRAALLALVDAMGDSRRLPGWAYEEPDALEDIRAAVDPAPAIAADSDGYPDKVHAGWLGRIAGCNLGKPVEQGDIWTAERIREYLVLADAYPLTDYFPVLDPMPEGFEFLENWPETTRGRVNGSARDDDIDYSLLALHLLETHGRALRPEHVGEAWTTLFPLLQTYTAERAAYINLVGGLRVPQVARFRNPYREWIGAQIRGDVFGYVNPGDPWAAAALAYQDAALSHTGNGVYGEMWAAALVAGAFTASDAAGTVEAALTVVPPRSRLHEAVSHVLRLRSEGATWEAALTEIRSAYGHYSWVHTINNAAAVTAALLWSDGDYTSAVGKVVMSGWDTDSNGATVGSVAGILTGTTALPAHLIEPLNDRTRSALFGFDNSVISDLAARTVRLAQAG